MQRVGMQRPLVFDTGGKHTAKKKEPARGRAGSYDRYDYCGDVTAATGCRLRETILVPITSPETINSTRRFC